MKIQMRFKTPDALYHILRDIKDEEEYERLEKALKQWIQYEEFVSIVFDTEKMIAEVLRVK